MCETMVFQACLSATLLLHRSQVSKNAKSKQAADSARPVSTDATASYSQGITLSKNMGYKPQEQTSIERYLMFLHTSLPFTTYHFSFTDSRICQLQSMEAPTLAILWQYQCCMLQHCRPEMSRAQTPFRKTKIVCTIGPTSCSREDLFRLADQGMNVARCAVCICHPN